MITLEIILSAAVAGYLPDHDRWYKQVVQQTLGEEDPGLGVHSTLSNSLKRPAETKSLDNGNVFTNI